MEHKAAYGFQVDLIPALAELGADVHQWNYNSGSGVLTAVVVLREYTWERRRSVLEAVTTWQNRFPEDVDADVAVLSQDDLAVTG